MEETKRAPCSIGIQYGYTLFETNLELCLKRPLDVFVIESHAPLFEVEAASDVSSRLPGSCMYDPIFVFLADVPPQTHAATQVQMTSV